MDSHPNIPGLPPGDPGRDLANWTDPEPAVALASAVTELGRLGAALDIAGINSKQWEATLGILFHASRLNGYSLTAVAGGQGAGKTTLVSNLYDGVDEWLRPNTGRGERHPVAVVETEDITEPRGVVVRRVPKKEEPVTDIYDADDRDAWIKVTRGQATDVLMIRLEVPYRIWNRDKTGFVLLPGFERLEGDHWQTLMRVVLSASTSVVVVTDGERLADGMQAKIVEDLRPGGGGADVVVALSRSDGKPPERLAELTTRAAEVFGVPEDLVVPFGPESDVPAGWVEHFTELISKRLPDEGFIRRNETALLRDIVRDDLAEILNLGRRSADNVAVAADGPEAEVNEVMKWYDKGRDDLLESLIIHVEAAFNVHYAAASRQINKKMRAKGGEWLERKWEFITGDTAAQDERLLQLVDELWAPDTAIVVQRTALDKTADERLNGRLPAEQAALVLLKLEGLSDAGPSRDVLREAVTMLPAMALRARAVTVGVATGDGRIPMPSESDITAQLKDVLEYQQLYIGAFSDFLNMEMPDGKGGTVKPVAAGLRTVLTAADNRAAAAKAAKAAAQAGTNAAVATGGAAIGGAAGGAAGAEAAVAGASLVGPALLAVAAVTVTAAALARATNKNVRERGRLAEELLREYRANAVQNAQDSVSNLLRLTREVLLRRLEASLGVGDTARRRLELLQGVAATDRARERVLRALAADHAR